MLNWLKRIIYPSSESYGKPSGTKTSAIEPIVRESNVPVAPDAKQISTLINEGFSLLHEGKFSEANERIAHALQLEPNHPDALYLSGLTANELGQIRQAIALISQAIANDDQVAAYHLTLAGILTGQQRHDEAFRSFERSLALDASNTQGFCDYAHALFQSGKTTDAIDQLEKALALEPGRNDIRYNLAVILQSTGRIAEAISHYQKIVASSQNHVDAWNNLGAAFQALGNSADAATAFRHAIQLLPEHAATWSNLGCALQASRKLDEAENSLIHAVILDPQHSAAYSNLGLVYRELGQMANSRNCIEHTLCIDGNLSERVRKATLLPVIAQSAAEILSWRQHFEHEIDALMHAQGTIDDPLQSVGTCNFNLAYQPECDRFLQEKAAAMYLRLAPSLNYIAPHCIEKRPHQGRIKVGFISKFMHRHSIGRTTRGLLANLSQNEFEVTALFVPPFVDDEISQFICERADHHVQLPQTLEAARETIAQLELDILFYQDIGMDAYTYFLAYSRLAPVQCVSFGHPDTTGIPNMDYWVSTEGFEPVGAQEHYSEKLYLLKNIATLAYYYRPTLQNTARTRAYFGLPQDKTLYGCPQSLFKLHPDFDTILAAILRGDPQGEIVLVESNNASWGQMVRDRFQRTMPDVTERIRFVPAMSTEDFLSLVALADVILDTIYFNGMNTSLEAFAVNVPIATMPSGMQRGRHTYGMYRQMGLLDCIADSPESYVDIALRLGRDKAFNAAFREKISARNHVLFEDTNVAREFERFFRDACAQTNLH
jgi:predicted O-linked N-acetylglucosamine transferase (SPINDLY family)